MSSRRGRARRLARLLACITRGGGRGWSKHRSLGESFRRVPWGLIARRTARWLAQLLVRRLAHVARQFVRHLSTTRWIASHPSSSPTLIHRRDAALDMTSTGLSESETSGRLRDVVTAALRVAGQREGEMAVRTLAARTIECC